MPPTDSHIVSTDQVPHRETTATEEAALETAAVDVPEKTEDVPPDGGYGWVCTACNFFINAHTWGINSVSSVYSLHVAPVTY
jgi:hypothetical protein